MPARASFGRALLERLPRHLGVVVGRALAVAHPRADPARERDVGLGVVVQRRDQLAEAGVVLGQPFALGLQRLGQPRQLLVGREVAVAHHGGRGDGEVDRAEQRVVELGLGLGQADRRRRRQPDHVHVLAELAEHRAHDVAPQRREVVALVEQHDADAHLGQLLHAPRGGRGEQVAQLDARVLAARDLALERGADPRQLARAAVGGGALERLALAQGLLRRHAGRGRALVRPARLREPAEHDLGVLELAQRLVGEAGDRLQRVRAGDHRRVWA